MINKAYAALLTATILLVPSGAFVIFSIESPNEHGYGDLVPVTDLGRIFTIFYMFSGIVIAGVFLSLLTTRFYKKRIEPSVEHEATESEKKIMKKFEELEKQQKQNTETGKTIKKIRRKDLI